MCSWLTLSVITSLPLSKSKALIPNVRSISNKDIFHSNSSLYLFAFFSFLDSSDHGVGISNSLSESEKHTSLGEHSVSLLAMRRCYGPAGIVQTTKLRKIADTRKGGEESVMSTQEYIRKVIEDVGEDDDFMRASWLSVLDYVNEEGGIVTGCFGDVKKFLKNGKLEKVVAVIKSCTPNALGDLTITLKDLSGTISGTIHYKVLTEESTPNVTIPLLPDFGGVTDGTRAKNHAAGILEKISVRKIVEKRVAKAIEKYEKTRADSNNTGGSGSTNTGGTVVPEMHGCSYKTFMNGKPHSFKGTKGVVGLKRWFEKMEQVFEIFKCAKDDKVKFVMCTFEGRAITWWNRNVQTLGLANANQIP
ncbi:hypothetical protein Tco_1485524 [Tanacetum coccineum]